MSTQERLFAAVERWLQSGQEKKEFLQGQDFSESKFNYWVSTYPPDQPHIFRPLVGSDIRAQKIL